MFCVERGAWSAVSKASLVAGIWNSLFGALSQQNSETAQNKTVAAAPVMAAAVTTLTFQRQASCLTLVQSAYECR